MQLTLTGTLAGLGLGQLVLGPLSDSVGRRRLVLVIGASPVLAPTIGGEMLRWTDWRGVFLALAVLGLGVTVMAAIALPETLPPARRRTGGVLATLRTYAGLLADRTFVALVLVAGLNASALATAVVSSGTLLVVALTGAGGLAGLLVPLFVLLGAIGLIGPDVSALGLSLHGEAAGTAAALFGSLNFGLGALAAPVVGLLGNDSLAMAAVMAGGAGLAATVLLLGVRLRVLWSMDLGDPEPVGTLPAT